MSSIASRTKTVQRNSTEETKASQETTENQWEGLHIAGEATSNAGEQGESRQSGAKHPSESAEQGFCKTAPSESAEQDECEEDARGEGARAEQDFCKTGPREQANKYKYQTFEGYAGERYLQEIMKDILPRALARTWAAAVSYQAPSNVCYVGVSRLAQKERLGERTIQKNFQELRRRGLLKTYGSWITQKRADGSRSQQAVVVKDFRKLYDLAYEYHLWVHAEEYIPADWECADLIRENKELYEKLMRFDNYRRILCCEKPGPKEQLSPLQGHYQWYDQEHQKEEYGLEEAKTNNYLPKQLNKCSPYRESKDPGESIVQENSTSKEFLEEGVLGRIEREAIRNVQQSGETIAKHPVRRNRDIQNEERKNAQTTSNPIESRNQIKEEKCPEAAKEVEEIDMEHLKKNPFVMAAFLVENLPQLSEEKPKSKSKGHRKSGQPKRKRRSTPEQLAYYITTIVQRLGGNSKYLQSDITRITKLYWACTQIFSPFQNAWFLEQLSKAYVQTCNARNVSKRVPYFFTTLENILELTSEELAYIRSQEALYCDGDLKTFVLGLQRLYKKSGSLLEYQEWVKRTYL